jgi:hypothetical protein
MYIIFDNLVLIILEFTICMTSYVHHEGFTRQSSDDVISFIIQYLQNVVLRAVEEIHLFL